MFCAYFYYADAAWAQPSNPYVIKDIPYKIFSNKDTVKLDLFLPKIQKFSKTPLVINIHGGAWVSGDKNIENYYYLRTLRDSLQGNGFALMSINYRLLQSDIHLKDQVSDVYSALEWLKNNFANYNIDLDRVGVIGESAGAHLALLLTYSDIENPSADIKYIVDLFGPTDINQLLRTRASWVLRTLFKWLKPDLFKFRNKLLLQMTQFDIRQNKKKVIETAALYSPINYTVGKKKTPILIQHGTKDPIVPYKQSIALKKKMDQQGVENILIKVPKANHGFTTTPKPELNKLVLATLSFILKQNAAYTERISVIDQ